MGFIKHLLLVGALTLTDILNAQITQEQVDQVNQDVFPQYTNMVTYNSNTQFQIPGGESTLIYTSAAGHQTDSTNTFIAAVAEQDSVTPEQQAIADGDPLRHLWTYDRNEYNNPEQYADSLNSFLSQYFTITNINENKREKNPLNFFPNPVVNYGHLDALLPGGKDVNVYVTDMQGKIVSQVGKQTDLDGKTEFEFNFGNLAKGIYNVILNVEGKNYTTKVVNQ